MNRIESFAGARLRLRVRLRMGPCDDQANDQLIH